MLILSRKNGESILLDVGIKVMVNSVKGNVAQLGIEAPKEISIRRSEIAPKSRESVPKHAFRQD